MATERPGASQIRAKPTASTIMQTSATLAPPIRSGTWPNNRRAATSATAKAVNTNQTGLHPRCAASSEPKAMIAPKPILLSAEPKPGIQTAAATFKSEDLGPRGDATAGKGA